MKVTTLVGYPQGTFFARKKFFFPKKVSKSHFSWIKSIYSSDIEVFTKMTLLNIFTKMYHRSVINSIEVSLKCGKLRTERLILRNYV